MAFDSLVEGGGRLTQPFGCTCSGLEWTCPGRCACGSGYHAGIDVATQAGTPLKAIGYGQVVQLGENCGCCTNVAGGCGTRCGLGPYAVIIRSGGVLIKYGHVSAALVRVGDQVTPQQRVALMGTCGCSTGPHVHFEVQPLAALGGCVGNGCNALDPLPYLSSWPGAVPGPPGPPPTQTADPVPALALAALTAGGLAMALWAVSRRAPAPVPVYDGADVPA